MEEKLLATYVRESTLWPNANAFYKAQDWTKMECLFVDYSGWRNSGDRVLDGKTKEDITEIAWADRYVIRLTNKRGTNSKSFEFFNREDANAAVKDILHHKVLRGWKKVKQN